MKAPKRQYELRYDTPETLLATTIIYRAVKDEIEILKGGQTYNRNLAELLSFFKSPWFALLWNNDTITGEQLYYYIIDNYETIDLRQFEVSVKYGFTMEGLYYRIAIERNLSMEKAKILVQKSVKEIANIYYTDGLDSALEVEQALLNVGGEYLDAILASNLQLK